MVRGDVQDVPVDVDRADRILELVVVEVGDPVAERDHLRGIGGEIRFALQDAEQVRPRLGRLVEGIEPGERRQVVGIDLQDALVAVDRLGVVLELLLVDRADLGVETLLLLRVVDDLRLLVVDGEERLPLLEAEVELDELVHGGDVLRIELESLVVDLDRVLGPLEQLLVEGRRAVEVLLLLVEGRQDLRLLQVDLRQLLVALVELEEPLERGRRLEVHLVELEDSTVVRDGGFVVAELVLANPRRLHVEAGREHRVVDLGDLLLVGLRERLGVTQHRGEPLQLLLGELVGRVLGEGAAVALEGRRVVVHRHLVELGDAMKELDPTLGRRGVLGLDLVDPDELRHGPRVPVDRLEDLRDEHLVVGHLQEPLEGLERLRLGRIPVEHLAVDLDGRLGGVHLGLAEVRQADHQRRLGGLVGRQLELAVDVVGQLGPHLLTGEEVVEGPQRASTGGIELQDLPVDGDGRLRVVQELVVDGGHLGEERLALLGVGGLLHPTSEHRHEVGPPLGAPEELLEGEQHLRVRRVDVEDLPVGVDGPVDVLQLGVLNRRGLEPERPRQVRLVDGRRQLGEQLHQLGEALLRHRDHLELSQGLLAAGILAEGLGVSVERLLLVHQPLAVDLGHLGEQVEALVRVGATVVQDPERANQRLPLALHLVDGLEDARRQDAHLPVDQQPLQSAAGARMLRHEGEHLAVELDRPLLLVEVQLERPREAELQRRELLGRLGTEVDASLEGLGELLPAMLLLVEPVERLERLDLTMAPLTEDLVEGVDGPRGVLELLLVEPRAAIRGRATDLGVVLELHLSLGDLEELGELLGLLVEVGQRGDRSTIIGLGLVHGPVGGDRVFDAIHLPEHPTEVHPELDGVHGVGGLDGLLVGLDDRVPATRRLGEALDVLPNDLLSRHDPEGLEVSLEGGVRLAKPLLVELAGLAQQRHVLHRLHRVLQAHLVDPSELPGVPGLFVDGRESLGSSEVVLVPVEDLLVGAGGAVGLTLLLDPQARGAEEEIDPLLRRGLLAVRLALEHADQLAPLVLRPVELLQLVPRAKRHVATLELLLGSAIVGVDGEQLGEGANGASVVTDLVRVDRPELLQHLRVRIGVGERLQDGCQLLPLAGPLVELSERLERLRVPRLGLEDLLPERDDRVGLADALGGQLRHLDVAKGTVGRIEHLGFPIHDPDQALPVATLLVRLLESGDRFEILRLVLEHLLEDLDGLGLVARALEVHVPGVAQKSHLLSGLLNDLRLGEDGADHVRPAALALELLELFVELSELGSLLVGQLAGRSRRAGLLGATIIHGLRRSLVRFVRFGLVHAVLHLVHVRLFVLRHRR